MKKFLGTWIFDDYQNICHCLTIWLNNVQSDHPHHTADRELNTNKSQRRVKLSVEWATEIMELDIIIRSWLLARATQQQRKSTYHLSRHSAINCKQPLYCRTLNHWTNCLGNYLSHVLSWLCLVSLSVHPQPGVISSCLHWCLQGSCTIILDILPGNHLISGGLPQLLPRVSQ